MQTNTESNASLPVVENSADRKRISHLKIILLSIAAVFVIALIAYVIYFIINFNKPKHSSTTPHGLTYKIDGKYNFKLNTLASGINQVTRIKITPDGKLMFVSTLPGVILVFKKDDSIGGMFMQQDTPFFIVDTKLDGLPRENGLTGFAFASDFEKSKEIFLTYTTLNSSKEIKNRVARIEMDDSNINIVGKNFTVIFEGNVSPSQAHQIQNGVGLDIKGKSHFMFTIGDAFVSSNAHDITSDAGKIMLIQRDGSNPEGIRPYTQSPKVQAVGLRNAYDIVQNPYDIQKRFFVGDTGDASSDKLIYGSLLSLDGNNNKGIDLKWDGKDSSQKLNIPDLFVSGNPNMNLYQWDTTITPLDIEFLKGGIGNIPTSTNEISYFLITLFGKTGSSANTPGKEIMLGKLTNLDTQPKVELTPFISRSPNGEGFQGQPIGLAVDPTTQNIYFADIFESKIYQVSEGENNTNQYIAHNETTSDFEDMTREKNIAIKIQNFAYASQAIRVKKGTTVSWTNSDLIHHTVTSENGSELNSESLGQNDTFKHTFNTVGVFNYYCKPHPFMKGSIEVVQ